MKHACPSCQREQDEAGFCPFDGTELVAAEPAGVHKPTVLSAYMRAQSDADTLPSQPPTEPEQEAPRKVRALSAAGPGAATVREAFVEVTNEYDRLVGETLDHRYYVQRKIGEGGMGVVFAVKHNVIERPLAIKVLKREAMRDNATVQRFKQEARAASRIGHPNIVDVTDFGVHDGLTFSVMEYIDGSTLAKAIKHSAPFAPERAIRIATQIARALGAAHDKGIVHRDLKPENVFLIEREGRPDFVKIVDFGIAKVQPLDNRAPDAPRLTRSGSVFGTPEYMAPEQAAGKLDTDRRVDIYALGTILYEMLTGKVPHKGNSTVGTIAMQMLDPIAPLSQSHPGLVPVRLDTILMKSLAKQREDRYQTMAELGGALDAFAAEQPLALPPVPPGADATAADAEPPKPEPPRRQKPLTKQLHEPEFVGGSLVLNHALVDSRDEPAPPKRRRWPLVVLVLAALLAAGLAVFVVMRADRDDERRALNAGTRDAAIAETPRDAALVVETEDASVVQPPPDAAHVPPDARASHRVEDAGTAIGPHPKSITIEVQTTPGSLDLYAGATRLGGPNTRIERPYGTKLTVECHDSITHHYKGSVRLVFDSDAPSVVNCAGRRLPACAPDPNGGVLPNPHGIGTCDPDPEGDKPVTRPKP